MLHNCPSCKCEITDFVDVTFELLWSRYPKKVGKKSALKAWKKISPVDHNKIFAALSLQRSSDQWKSSGGKYIPHLSTWLNGERWEDEVMSSERQEIIL